MPIVLWHTRSSLMKIRTIVLTLGLFLLLTPVMAQGGMTYNEAPMLAELVASGQLPPVEDRLPTNPRVFPVYEEIGIYGGTLHRAYNGISDRWGPTKLIEERILEFEQTDPETVSLVPGYIDEWLNLDASAAYAFTLKEGLRWSDGTPVTTRDVQFWYEDIFLNPELTPVISELYQVDGEPLTIEIIDEQTFLVRFIGSYPLFPEILAKESTGAPGLDRPGFLQPFHYLSQYHPNYVDEGELNSIAQSYGVASWLDLWGDSGPIQSWWLNPDLPVITPWRVVVPPPAEVVVMERNPYYYGIDAAGNQLPYIDRIEHRLFGGDTGVTMDDLIISGQIDVQSRHVGSNIAFYQEHATEGNYSVVQWSNAGTEVLIPNLNTTNESLATLYSDPRFIQALNISIDRNLINEQALLRRIV